MRHHSAGESFSTCDYCTDDVFTVIATSMGTVELCWAHTRQFSGWSAEELEIHHAPKRDHLRDAKAKAYDIETERGLAAASGRP